MPDDQVQFLSPTTGKVQPVSSEDWDEALKQGYQPISHKVMYSPDGKRGMVLNEDMHDYIKQGYQTSPQTQFEKERAPGYRSPEDTQFLNEIGLKPTDIKGVTDAAMLGVGAGGIGRTIAQKGLKAAIGPIAKGLAGTTAGAATGHYLGRLVGMPVEGAAIGGLAGGLMGGFRGEKVPTPEPEPFPPEATSTGRPSMTSPVGQTQLSPPPSIPVKPAAPPNPFSGMTSSAAPIGNAELPPAPKGAVTTTAPTTATLPVRAGGLKPPPPVNGEAGPSTPATQPTSLLSRGRTLITPGMEPDLNDPVHVKMINDYQTMSGPKLRELSSAGDRFAAFVLRHMPRPGGP